MAAGGGAASRRTRIKLCGITTTDEVEMAVDAGVDALGLVFTAGAPNCLLPHTAMQLAKRIPPFVSVVGVFSNPSDPDLMVWPGRWVQLIGNEDEAQMQRVARLRSIIKGFPYDTAQLRRWDRCAAVGAMLVQLPADATKDGASASIIDEFAEVARGLHTPIVLGGSLTLENVDAWIHAMRPHGVDISGDGQQRSAADLREFVQAVRGADAAA